MGLIDKINRWRGIYDDSIVPEQEFASFPICFNNFEEFAYPFSQSMGAELFKAINSNKEIEDGVPYVLWGDRPASDEYVYILRTEELCDELLAKFEEEQQAFMDAHADSIKTVLISLVCVERSSDAFVRYCQRKPRINGFELSELVVGISFEEKLMHTCILTNCVGENGNRTFRKEFLRMIRAAENCF